MLFPGINWFSVSKRDPRVVALYSRHYSSAKNGKKVQDWLKYGITPPGEEITLLSPDGLALFVWLKQKYTSNGQYGVNCAVFRNEGNQKSSKLILEAEEIAWELWPGERLFTYVNPDCVQSSNPGYTFLMAGWQRLPEKTGKGLRILEKWPRNRSNVLWAPLKFKG